MTSPWAVASCHIKPQRSSTDRTPACGPSPRTEPRISTWNLPERGDSNSLIIDIGIISFWIWGPGVTKTELKQQEKVAFPHRCLWVADSGFQRPWRLSSSVWSPGGISCWRQKLTLSPCFSCSPMSPFDGFTLLYHDLVLKQSRI